MMRMQQARALSAAPGARVDGVEWAAPRTAEAPPGHNANCVSNLCAIGSGSSSGQCTDGLLGSACVDAGDCVEGTCAYSSGLGRGECTNGKVGSFCVLPAHCALGHCHTGGNSSGLCTTGATGQPCTRAQDCESASCVSRLCQ